MAQKIQIDELRLFTWYEWKFIWENTPDPLEKRRLTRSDLLELKKDLLYRVEALFSQTAFDQHWQEVGERTQTSISQV